MTFDLESGSTPLARCTHARKHSKTFQQIPKLCGNDHQQMLWVLAKFGGQITFEELSTKKTENYSICCGMSLAVLLVLNVNQKVSIICLGFGLGTLGVVNVSWLW